MSKHTPGPWIILKSANPDTVSRWTIWPDGQHTPPYYWGIAEVPMEPNRPEQTANARLIAAAPEMFSLIGELVGNEYENFPCDPSNLDDDNDSERCGKCFNCNFVTRLHAAIAKAEGRE